MNRFAATLLFAVSSSLTAYGYAQEPNEPQTAEVKISLYNDARVDDKVVADAMALATWLYGKAGVRTIWLNCSSSRVPNITDLGCHEPFGPTHLTVRIVARATLPKYDTFGVAFLSSDGIGVYSDVFYDRIQRLSRQDSRVSPSCALGHILAHEIGHLLLGVNAHSGAGIMRAGWREHEIAQAAMGALFFLPEQGKLMRARLIPLNKREETARISTRSAAKM